MKMDFFMSGQTRWKTALVTGLKAIFYDWFSGIKRISACSTPLKNAFLLISVMRVFVAFLF